QNIDWSRSNPEWEGKLLLRGRMLKTKLGIELAANTILKKCGIHLSDKRLNYENVEYVREKIVTLAKDDNTAEIKSKELQNG
ncbi:MAG: DNA sulfur modification protein DndB, partial [Nitrosopumilus sp.]|nr:DNA sulfur modification protein DndB [Nitrosopumilus sp.]